MHRCVWSIKANVNNLTPESVSVSLLKRCLDAAGGVSSLPFDSRQLSFSKSCRWSLLIQMNWTSEKYIILFDTKEDMETSVWVASEAGFIKKPLAQFFVLSHLQPFCDRPSEKLSLVASFSVFNNYHPIAKIKWKLLSSSWFNFFSRNHINLKDYSLKKNLWLIILPHVVPNCTTFWLLCNANGKLIKNILATIFHIVKVNED